MVEKKTRQPRPRRMEREREEFEQRIIDLARVTRVMAGGKRMRFRACVVIGDRRGRVAMGVAKGADVTIAINKAVAKAKKQILHVQFVHGTIAHEISEKYKAAKVLLRPAQKGKGIVAGGAMRQVFELVGVPNIVAKIQGSTNKINIVRATLAALDNITRVKTPDEFPPLPPIPFSFCNLQEIYL